MLFTRILRETVDDIFADPRATFVCLIPSLAGILVMTLLGILMGNLLGMSDVISLMWNPQASSALWKVLAAIAVGGGALAIGWVWSAVAWHRWILLREQPGAMLPQWHGAQVWAYSWRVVLVGFLVGLALFLILPIAGRIEHGDVSYEFAFDEPPLAMGWRAMAAWLLVIALFNGLSLRLSIILPFAAVGTPVGLVRAWKMTDWKFLTLFVPLGLLLMLVTLVIGQVSAFVSFGGVLDIFALCLQTLLGIGVLTRLHQYFVQQEAAVG